MTGRAWHFTCTDHGAPGIEADQAIVPGTDKLVWASLLPPAFASRTGLGLTSTVLRCDRMAACFEVDRDDLVTLEEYVVAHPERIGLLCRFPDEGTWRQMLVADRPVTPVRRAY